jgi:hypothetical protein
MVVFKAIPCRSSKRVATSQQPAFKKRPSAMLFQNKTVAAWLLDK